MRSFLDQTGSLWVKGALVGKVASVFASTATQHGGHQTTITSFHNTLLHQGMMPYSFAGLTRMDEVYGRHTLRRNDARQGRWLEAAERERARRRAFPGAARR